MAETKQKKFMLDVTPSWEATAEYFARALSDHSFNNNTLEPVLSLMDQVRYLVLTDRPAYDRIIARLRADEDRRRQT